MDHKKTYQYLSSSDVIKDEDDFTYGFNKKDAAKFLISMLCKTEGKDSIQNIVAKNYQPLVRSGIQSDEELREFCKAFPESFILMEDTKGPEGGVAVEVQVTSKVKMCSKHMHRHGSCPDDSKCGCLHLCKFYLLSGKCSFSTESKCYCFYGHRLHTDHNINVLKRHLMDHLCMKELCTLMKRPCNRSLQTRPTLCHFYNSYGGCSKDDACTSLHICRQFILDDCAYGERCILSHNLLDPSVIFILGQYAVGVEELKEMLLDNQREKRFSALLHAPASNHPLHAAPVSSLPDLHGWGSPARLSSSSTSVKNSRRRYGDSFKSSGSDAYSPFQESSSGWQQGKNNSKQSISEKNKRQKGSSTAIRASSHREKNSLVQTQNTEASQFKVVLSSPLNSGKSPETKSQVPDAVVKSSKDSLFQQIDEPGCSTLNKNKEASQLTDSVVPTMGCQSGLAQNIGEIGLEPKASEDFSFHEKEEQAFNSEEGKVPVKVKDTSNDLSSKTTINQKPLSNFLDSTKNKKASSGSSDSTSNVRLMQREPERGRVSSLTNSLQSIIANLISNVQRLHSDAPQGTEPESHFVSYLSELANPDSMKAEIEGALNQVNQKDKGLCGNEDDDNGKVSTTSEKVVEDKTGVEDLKHLSEGEISDSENNDVVTDDVEMAAQQDRLLFEYNHQSSGEFKKSDINSFLVVPSTTTLNKTELPSLSASRDDVLSNPPDSENKCTELERRRSDKTRKRSHCDGSDSTSCSGYKNETGTSYKKHKGELTKKDENLDYDAVDSSDDDFETIHNLENEFHLRSHHNEPSSDSIGHATVNQRKHAGPKVDERQNSLNNVRPCSADNRFYPEVTKEKCEADVHVNSTDASSSSNLPDPDSFCYRDGGDVNQRHTSPLHFSHVKNIGSEEMRDDVQRVERKSPGFRSTLDSFGRYSRELSSEQQQQQRRFREFSGSPHRFEGYTQNRMAEEGESRRDNVRSRERTYRSRHQRSDDQTITEVLPSESGIDTLQVKTSTCGLSRGDSRSLRERSAEGSTHSHTVPNGTGRHYSPNSFVDRQNTQDKCKRMSPEFHSRMGPQNMTKSKFSSKKMPNKFANYEEWKRHRHQGMSREDNLLSSLSEVKCSSISSNEEHSGRLLALRDQNHDESIRANAQQLDRLSPAYRDELHRLEESQGFGDSGSASLDSLYLAERVSSPRDQYPRSAETRKWNRTSDREDSRNRRRSSDRKSRDDSSKRSQGRGGDQSSPGRYSRDASRRMNQEGIKRQSSREKDSRSHSHRRSRERDRGEVSPRRRSGFGSEDRRQNVSGSYWDREHSLETRRKRSPIHHGNSYQDPKHDLEAQGHFSAVYIEREHEGRISHQREHRCDSKDRERRQVHKYYKTRGGSNEIHYSNEGCVDDDTRNKVYRNPNNPDLQNRVEVDEEHMHQGPFQVVGSHKDDFFDHSEEDYVDEFGDSEMDKQHNIRHHFPLDGSYEDDFPDHFGENERGNIGEGEYSEFSNEFENHPGSDFRGPDYGGPGYSDFQENFKDVGDLIQAHRKRVSPPDLRNVIRTARLQKKQISYDAECLQILVKRGRRQHFWKGKCDKQDSWRKERTTNDA